MALEEVAVLYARFVMRRFFLGGMSDSSELGLGGVLGLVMRLAVVVRGPSASGGQGAVGRVAGSAEGETTGRTWEDGGDIASKEKVISESDYVARG